VIRRKTVLALIAAALMLALMRAPFTGADEDEEQPITSSAAQVSRDATGEVFITIKPAAQKDIGLETRKLEPVARPVEVEAYGYILDPGPLSKLNSDLIGAQAALDASRAQYLRSKRLHGERENVSLRDLQSAQASYLADQSRLNALQQQLRDEWGGEIARMDPGRRSDLVSAIVDRRQAIARVTVPAGEGLGDSPAHASIVVLGREQHPLAARAVYYAPAVDPKMQGQSFILLMDADGFPIPAGVAISAALPRSNATERGVTVPRSAVVRYAGREWVYEALTPERFTRKAIVPAENLPDGYFVTENPPGEMRVVTRGAQSLLSEEQKQQIQPSD
jgi:hypothetical protein